MADKKISALTAASTPLAGTEVLPIVQSGSTVKVAVSDLTLGRNVSLLGLTATGTTQKLGAVTLADITVQIGPDTPATTSSGRILFNTSSTEKNWFINHNWNLAGGLSFAQSTAAGGSTMGSDSHQWDSSGNYKVVNGNVVIGTAGKGIDFSANTGTAGMTSELLNWYEEGNYTPTVAATTGAITSYTASAYYTRIGRQVTLTTLVTITDAGTGAGSLTITLPFTASGSIAFSGTGRENALTGNALQCNISAGGTVANVVNITNATAIATGAQVRNTVTYFV
jgi:hypothetical protein